MTVAACPWCHDHHGPMALCQRAQRGLSRRSFCFMFGVGMAGALLAPRVPLTRDFFGGLTNAYSLDDYEEGTWTPTIGDGGTSGQAYSTQVGRYTKIGNLIFVTTATGTITTYRV